MRVLIACATSCVALDAFLARGHDAWQCDLLPADKPTNRHIQDDVRNVLGMGWDLLLVSNPPCTRLCNSGVRWLSNPPTNPPPDCTEQEREDWPGLSDAARLEIIWRHLDAGAALFSDCLNAPIPHRAVENPVMHRYARDRIRGWIKPQIVQPWWFGDEAFKATGLYLCDLPPLVPTNRLTPPEAGTEAHKQWSAIHRAPPSADRWKIRSKTFPGMAEAWVDQWGGYAMEAAA